MVKTMHKKTVAVKWAAFAIIAAFALLLPFLRVYANDAPMQTILTLGDIHIDCGNNEEKFRRLLKEAAAYSPNIVINTGDNSDTWKDRGYKRIQELIREYLGDVEIVWAIGNHDYDNMPVDAARAIFREYAGANYYYSRNINGYDFIVLGVGDDRSMYDNRMGMLDDTQLSWLDTQLSRCQETSRGLPIFVVSHYPFLKNSLPDDVIDKLTRILRKYDNIVYIAGHEHYSRSKNLTEAVTLTHPLTGSVVLRAGSTYYVDKADKEFAQGTIIRRYYNKMEYTLLDISPTAAYTASTAKPISPNREIVTVYLRGNAIDGIGLIRGGNTYVPLRTTTAALGANLEDMRWDKNARATIIKINNTTLTVPQGQTLADYGGTTFDMGAESLIIDDTMYVPLKFIAELFRLEYNWDSVNRIVRLHDKE